MQAHPDADEPHLGEALIRVREVTPAAQLERHVRCYWAMGATSLKAPISWRVLPDGCADAIFEPSRGARWVGTMTRAIEVARAGVRIDLGGVSVDVHGALFVA